jgi:hypothetical protein
MSELNRLTEQLFRHLVGLWGGSYCLRCSAKYPVQEQSRPSLSPLGFCSDLGISATQHPLYTVPITGVLHSRPLSYMRLSCMQLILLYGSGARRGRNFNWIVMKWGYSRDVACKMREYWDKAIPISHAFHISVNSSGEGRRRNSSLADTQP